MGFQEADIREWVGGATFGRAAGLVASVHDARFDEAASQDGDWVVVGQLTTTRTFHVTFYFVDGCLWSECTCKARHDCVHGAALALVARRLLRPQASEPPAPPAAEPGWEARLAAFAARPGATAAPAFYVYRLRLERDNEDVALVAEFGKAGNKRFIPTIWSNHRPGYKAPAVELRIGEAAEQARWHGGGWQAWARGRSARTPPTELRLDDHHLSDFLGVLALHPRVEDAEGRAVRIHPTCPLAAGLEYEPGEDGPVLRPVVTAFGRAIAPRDARAFGPPGHRWAWIGDALHPLPAEAEALWADPAAAAPIRVPAADATALVRRWLPRLAAEGRLAEPAQSSPADAPLGSPVPQARLAETGHALEVALGFHYGDEHVDADDPADVLGPPRGPWVRRDRAAEARHREALAAAMGRPAPLEGADALAFLDEGVARLAAAGWRLVGRDRLHELRLLEARPAASMRVASGLDWFDVEATLAVGAEVVPWQAVQAALRARTRYVRLGTGGWARLPEKWLAAQRRLLERLGLDPEAAAALGAVRVPRHQAPLLGLALDEADAVAADAGWEGFRERLATFGGVEEAPIPAGFTGALRPYQRQGLSYLAFLRGYGLHGILADDMGLGKTVQAAALLASHHPGADGPSLVVAPASVVANWEAELRRFAPGLRVLRLHGPERDVGAIAAADVVITTYATARIDQEAHRAHVYDTLILDEAQAIKNPASQTATAMRALQARHRVCLTGTPIENDLGDLWSQFRFLMPGLLGGERDFKARYGGPIAAGDAAARAELQARVRPFILRRLKAEVATDLPPRTEITVRCDLAPAQRRAYETLLAEGRERVMAALDEKGLEGSRITVLDALLKLRQCCCHPALLATPATMHLASGKLEAAMELIHEVIAGGHRALVFSQFVKMLAILREQLDAAGVAYEYLDGATRDRQARVDRFNAGTTPLFLISLKAGGTGLNLVGADYVLHYDQWWNPAVEDQATDRAHRIGQTRQVFSYKLVARDTIEEKLLALQERKRGLVRDLLSTDPTGKQLTRKDLELLFQAPPEPA